VIRLGPRTLELAQAVVHELQQRMKPGPLPVFSSDGLRLYFCALTAHFGHWIMPEGQRERAWQIAMDRQPLSLFHLYQLLAGLDNPPHIW
jgi:hypothetical protein